MLHEIYRLLMEQEGANKASRALDKKMTELSESIDLERAQQDSDYVYSMLNLASAFGEEAGFATGFKYAVKLILYCFS